MLALPLVHLHVGAAAQTLDSQLLLRIAELWCTTAASTATLAFWQVHGVLTGLLLLSSAEQHA
jgi:hypothetical protein